MEVFITGIPVRYWGELGESLRQALGSKAKELDLPRPGATVHFFGSRGARAPLMLALDRRSSATWRKRRELAAVVHALCASHSRANECWYRGYYIYGDVD